MTTDSMQGARRVSILVKALNEERNIARCLAAAVKEAATVGGEVILVDSLSSDRTVEIAKGFPVRIVQFDRAADRGCGAATQLGYQFARGEYVYVLDADMELCPGFIATALRQLENDARLAGVGGTIIDTQVRTAADRRRVAMYGDVRHDRFVSHLGGGGLYRRRAIESVEYLANRWLQACEEADLGMRLRSNGWRLMRLAKPAVRHTGHDESTLGMFRRLWRSGRINGHGMFLRYALGRPWWWRSMRCAWHVWVAPVVHALSLLLGWSINQLGGHWIASYGGAFVLCWGSVAVCLYARKRSWADVLLSIATWHCYTFAAMPAFVGRVPSPTERIAARELHSAKSYGDAERGAAGDRAANGPFASVKVH